MPLLRNALAVLGLALLGGCAVAPERAAAPTAAAQATTATPAHDNLNATLWMQGSVEYSAVTLQVFRQACAALDAALADPRWSALPVPEQRHAGGFESRPPAVIADLDETLIDNSPYQARRVVAGGSYDPDSWRAWVAEADARAVPGALEFARCAQERGVALVYVSNRKHEGERAATIANLQALGFPLDDSHALVLLRGDSRGPDREKGTRRAWVAQRYRVLQLLGDNLGDFLDGVDATPAARVAMTDRYQDWWGERWFMLPNPSYGSWEDALSVDCATPDDRAACKRAQLRLQ